MTRAVSHICFLVLICSVSYVSTCDRDKNLQLEKPVYLQFEGGFFYIHGLTNGEVVVIYKHPEEAKIFGQYTFKDERCRFETVFYYVENEKFEFTNPYVIDERSFNISNKLNFNIKNEGYEIVYHVYSRGFGVFHNLKSEDVKTILTEPKIKKTPAVQLRGHMPNFQNVGKQNLKVSYMKNGENYIQFISRRNQFSSIEGQYTLRTSDRKYHSVTYEIPLNDFDFNGIVIREHEMSTEENFQKSGTLRIDVNKTSMDVKYFVNKHGFFVTDIEKPLPTVRPLDPPVTIPVTQKPKSEVEIKSQEITRIKRQPSITFEYFIPDTKK